MCPNSGSRAGCCSLEPLARLTEKNICQCFLNKWFKYKKNLLHGKRVPEHLYHPGHMRAAPKIVALMLNNFGHPYYVIKIVAEPMY
jgi:hypothetical protein